MTTVDNTNPIPQAPAGETQPIVMVPPTSQPLPSLPDWIPPSNTGQPNTSDLNDLSQYRRQTIAAINSAIPTCYGRDRFFGAIFVLHVDDAAGFMYVAYAFCKGEIEAFETIYMDGVDITDPNGFLSVAGAVKEEYTGTTSQTASATLSGAIVGFADDYANLAYLVFKVPAGASQGFPRVEAVIQGKKVYDLRKDSTNAEYDAGLGVSTHRIADVTTWEYTTNPSICFADFVYTFTDWTLAESDLAENATYNDVLVGGVPRRELGLTLLRASTIEKWMQGFRPYCGVYFTWEAGELRMITERADVEAPGALIVDGAADSWVDMGDQTELDMGASQDFTLECKMRMTDTVTLQVPVGKKSDTPTVNAGYCFYVTDSVIRAAVSDGTTQVVKATPAGTYDDDSWNHVAMTVDRTADELILYTNGVAGTAVDISGVTLTLENALDFRVGAAGGGSRRFDGAIDEVRVWNDVRTPAEIADNMDVEIADPELDASLVGYWKLNDATGQVAVDSSASANDGTLTGNAGWAAGDLLLIPDGVVRHFEADDINNRGFTLRKKPNRSTPTEVQVEYTDAAGKSWPVARQRAQASGVDAGSTPRRVSKISMPGIHSAAQANRLAIERLNWFLSDLECSLPVFDEGLEVQQGSVVAVTHPIGLTSKLFRVRGITGSSGRWVLDLAEYDPQIYSNAVISDPTYPDTQLGDPLNPPMVSGLTAVEELYITKDGSTGSRVRVGWTASAYPFLSQYRVEGIVGGIVVWQTFVGINEAVSPGVEQLVSDAPVDYDVKVYVRSAFGEGGAADADVQIQGKLAPPSNVPSPAVVRIGADTVKLSWGKATDIDIWRYEVRQGTGTDTWATMSGNSVALVDDLNFLVEGLDTGVNYRWGIKAIDSVRNESTDMASVNLTLANPTPLTSLNGFEIAGEVRLNWAAPADPYVARYRVAYDDYPTPTAERTLDIVDTLTFSTRDVAAGDYTFKVYSRDQSGNEAATSADRVITVTLDTDSFLADEYDFDTPSLTNMVQYNLRVDTRDFYVTNDGAVFISSPSSFADHTSDALANYHSDTTLDASEWLSETKDFGLLLTGNWLITDDIEVLNGSITKALELSTDNVTYDTFTSGNAKGEYRYARYRINTFNPPGTDTAFVKVPEVNLKINVVPLEENGDAFSLTSAGKTINLSREYTAVKEINVQPKNKTDALMAIVDNIIVGANTGVQSDGTNYLQGGDWAAVDHSTGDFSMECWGKHAGGTNLNNSLAVKRDTGVGYNLRIDEVANEFEFVIDDGTTTIVCTTVGDACPDDGAPHHIAVTVDRTADDVIMYVDGSSTPNSTTDISTVTGDISNAGNFNVLANSLGSGVGNLIDDLRVWSDVRSGAEIAANYATELDMTTTHTGLVGYWRMNGVTSAVLGGGTVDDAVPASTNDLTDTGAGDTTYVDMGISSPVEKINSFDAYVFDIFGQQLLEEFQWNWKAV